MTRPATFPDCAPIVVAVKRVRRAASRFRIRMKMPPWVTTNRGPDPGRRHLSSLDHGFAGARPFFGGTRRIFCAVHHSEGRGSFRGISPELLEILAGFLCGTLEIRGASLRRSCAFLPAESDSSLNNHRTC